jgi:hemerythrin-like domain-containing protein
MTANRWRVCAIRSAAAAGLSGRFVIGALAGSGFERIKQQSDVTGVTAEGGAQGHPEQMGALLKLEQLLGGGVEGSATLERPLEHLMACHDRIEERLRMLEKIASHLDTRREEALGLLAKVLKFFDTNGVWHTEDEEESLFPRLGARANEEERCYLAELESQHDEAEHVYAALKSVAARLAAGENLGSQFARLVDRLCSLYRPHIASENRALTELGTRLLTADELAAVAAEMKWRRGL